MPDSCGLSSLTVEPQETLWFFYSREMGLLKRLGDMELTGSGTVTDAVPA